MATNNFILTIEEVKERTNLTRNIDDKTLTPSMRYVHLMVVQNIVGKSCYDDLIDQVANNTLTAANSTLLEDYLRDFTAWMVASDALEAVNTKVVNSGVTRSADVKDIDRLRLIAQSKAEAWRLRTIAYIDDNISSYPCYNISDNVIEKNRNSIKNGGFVR